MQEALTRRNIAERLHANMRENYLLIANVNKGLALAIAALALLEICEGIRKDWPELLPWLACLATVLVAHMKWNRGVILANIRVNALDTIFAVAVGISEFVMFGVFLNDSSSKGEVGSHVWMNWPLCLAFQTFFIYCLLRNRISQVSVPRDFEPELARLGHEYVAWLRRDRTEVFRLTVGLAMVWALEMFMICPYCGVDWCRVANLSLAVVCLVAFVRVMVVNDRQLMRISALVLEFDGQQPSGLASVSTDGSDAVQARNHP